MLWPASRVRARLDHQPPEIGGAAVYVLYLQSGGVGGAHRLIDCGFKRHISGKRYRIREGQDLRGPIAAQPGLAVDPVKAIRQSGP